MSHDVQQYDRTIFQRVEEAVKCRVHAALFMPLYISVDREYPVAVFEIVQTTKNVLFPALIDMLIASLQVIGQHCAPAVQPSLQHHRAPIPLTATKSRNT